MLRKHENKLSAVVAIVTVVAIANCLPTSAGAADLPEKVVQALKSNAEALDPVTISWEQKRSSRLPLDKLLQLTKQPDDKAFFYPQNVTVTYQGGAFSCFRKYREWRKPTGKFFTWYRDCRFDGKVLYFGNSMDPIPLITVEDLNHATKHYPNANRFHAEYLVAAGFKVHNRSATIDHPPESDLLYLADHGGQISSIREVVIDSNKFLWMDVAMAEGRTRFLLDPSMQYAVHRMEKYNRNGDLTQTTTNSQFVELPSPHVWLPKQCRVSDYTWWTIPETVSKKPIVLTDIVVQTLNQKPGPPDRFVIDLKPGTTVLDSRPEAAAMPGASLGENGVYLYRIAPTGEDLANAVAVSSGRRRVVLVAFSALLVVLTGTLVFRKYRRQRGTR